MDASNYTRENLNWLEKLIACKSPSCKNDECDQDILKSKIYLSWSLRQLYCLKLCVDAVIAVNGAVQRIIGSAEIF